MRKDNDIIPPNVSVEEFMKEIAKEEYKEKLKSITAKTKKKDLSREIKQYIDIQVRQNILSANSKFMEDIGKLQDQMLSINKNVANVINDILSSNVFWHRFDIKIRKWLSETIDAKLRNADYHNLVRESLKSQLKIQLRTIISDVAEGIMKSINKKFYYEYNITRQLITSTESQIRHLTQRLPLSEFQTKIIKDTIEKNMDMALKVILSKEKKPKKLEVKI